MPAHNLESPLSTDPDLVSDIERLLTLREEAADRVTETVLPGHSNGHDDAGCEQILRDMFRV